jgi:hypothetical protein
MGKAVDLRQSETGAFPERFGREERLENPRQDVQRNITARSRKTRKAAQDLIVGAPRLDGEPDSVPLFRQADVTPIPLRIVEDEPELRLEVEVGKELATPFNPSRAPSFAPF